MDLDKLAFHFGMLTITRMGKSTQLNHLTTLYPLEDGQHLTLSKLVEIKLFPYAIPLIGMPMSIQFGLYFDLHSGNIINFIIPKLTS